MALERDVNLLKYGIGLEFLKIAQEKHPKSDAVTWYKALTALDQEDQVKVAGILQVLGPLFSPARVQHPAGMEKSSFWGGLKALLFGGAKAAAPAVAEGAATAAAKGAATAAAEKGVIDLSTKGLLGRVGDAWKSQSTLMKALQIGSPLYTGYQVYKGNEPGYALPVDIAMSVLTLPMGGILMPSLAHMGGRAAADLVNNLVSGSGGAPAPGQQMGPQQQLAPGYPMPTPPSNTPSSDGLGYFTPNGDYVPNQNLSVVNHLNTERAYQNQI